MQGAEVQRVQRVQEVQRMRQSTCRCSRRLHRQHRLGEGDSCSSRGDPEQTSRRRAEQYLCFTQGGGVRGGRPAAVRLAGPRGVCAEGQANLSRNSRGPSLTRASLTRGSLTRGSLSRAWRVLPSGVAPWEVGGQAVTWRGTERAAGAAGTRRRRRQRRRA